MRLFTAIDKSLWLLALPMIFSNLSVPLLGLIDTAVIGHLDSPIYLGGVAIGTMATSFLFMLLLFLRMSTTGIAAQADGAQDKFALARTLVQPLLLAFFAGLAIIALRHPLMELVLFIVKGQSDVLQQARLFMSIRWLSAPATLANFVILGWLLGVQYTRAPVILLITGNIINIILDLGFVGGMGWKVVGVASATVIADYFTLLLGGIFIVRVIRLRGLKLQHFYASWRGNVRQLLALNRDIMLRSLLLNISLASLTILASRMGNDIVAVNVLLMNLLTFTTYALDGFAYAVEVHSGKAFGARDREQFEQGWRAACRQAGLLALIFSIIYAIFGNAIVHLLTSLPQLQMLALHYLPWQIVLPLCGVWCYLLDGLFIGATRGADMRNSMLIAVIGYGATLFLAAPIWGNHGLWLALSVLLILRGITLWWIWHKAWQQDRWFPSSQEYSKIN